MMESIFKKSSWMALITAGILFSLLVASNVFADYSGHVASFKSEKNAIMFVHKMKAKGLIAYYQKEDVPGKVNFTDHILVDTNLCRLPKKLWPN